MNKFIGYIIAKAAEVVLFTVALLVYAIVLYPDENPDWIRQLYLSFALVFTFFIVSLYVVTSLAAHLAFQDRLRFGFYCVGAYTLSALIFLALNPIEGTENLLIFVLPLPIVYLIGGLAKRLALKLRPKVPR
ncbi:hypothetical protein L5849_00020 [Erythrobacter sp. SN021]|uniref:hypothetical protein n=1 Tax=Erythrobacter sp. SN021 TaxID=2912574 RepID=UPI001F3A8D99|nr:hypothetical protein [Erythrobacter sp. SN021]MCF8881079.1 hypothetical protein [Erythrobacter sp. SN021]